MLSVAQSSVLGLLLLILYINDINTAVKVSKLNTFADDTLLTVTGDSVNDCIEKIMMIFDE